MTLFVTLALGAGLAVVWVRVVQTLKETPAGPGTIGQPGALVWDGRVFTSPAQLKSYLSARGLSYSRWAARHPTAFGGTAPARTTTKKPTKTAVKTATTPKPKPVTHVAAPSLSESSSRPLASIVLTILLLLGGVALGASAALPPRLVPETVRNFYYAQPDRRTVALAAATAILLGFGVSFYLA